VLSSKKAVLPAAPNGDDRRSTEKNETWPQ
jgi:hypothetical protein